MRKNFCSTECFPLHCLNSSNAARKLPYVLDHEFNNEGDQSKSKEISKPTTQGDGRRTEGTSYLIRRRA
jgi:hypothetical protein